MFHVKKEGSKYKILGSDFREIFARVQLRRWRLQNKVRKNFKVGAKLWKRDNINIWK